MNIAIGLAALTAIATTAGGYLAIRAKDRLHLVLGLSAGLLLGLVAFDLLPEVFELWNSRDFPCTRSICSAHCGIPSASFL